MGPYIVLLFLILAGLGAWNIGGMLSKNNISKKEPPKPSNLEQKLKNSVQKTQEEVLIQREELQRLRKKLADQKVEKEQQKKEYHMVDISKYQDQGIHKLCFIAFNREDIEKTKILLPNYHFIVHEMFSQHSINGEIIKKGMDKGLAIKKIVETLHMKMEDTIAFGDSMNDYEMLQVCNYGVAMKNACQELKASADNICESVENDGVYYEMERLGLFECLD